jgi:tol-pal system protein YbgF
MLLRKFLMCLYLFSAVTVSAQPIVHPVETIDSPEAEVIEPSEMVEHGAQDDTSQLRQQLDQLRDVILDQEDKLSQQQKEIQKLRGDNEVLQHKIDQVQKQQQDIFLDMDKRLQALQTPPPAEMPPAPVAHESKDTKAAPAPDSKSVKNPPVAKSAEKPTDSVLAKEALPPPAKTDPPKSDTELKNAAKPEVTPPPKPVETPPTPAPLSAEDEEQHYQRLMKWVDEGQEQQAATGFEEFLQRYPQSKRGDDAQYWLGESYYAVGNYHAALKAFNTLVTNYPQSQKYSQALLKIAFSHYELKDYAKARELLQRVRNDYAGTAASRLAERRLKKMTIEGH